MKKSIIGVSGFMLVETLVVTIFVSGVLLFLFIQFSNLSKSYEESFKFNTVEDLYALDDIKDYIESDQEVLSIIDNIISTDKYIDITDCAIFKNQDYCSELLKLENIKKIYVAENDIESNSINENDEAFKQFIFKIKPTGNHKYRLIANFNDSTYATLRFGDQNE